MTMKALYIVYITNCFLWTMSDNKAYLILSYPILNSVSHLQCSLLIVLLYDILHIWAFLSRWVNILLVIGEI